MTRRLSGLPVFTMVCALAWTGSVSAGVPSVNQAFVIQDCGTPVQVLRLIASTLYRHPDTGQLHLFLEYGANNGYGMGERPEDTAHEFVDVELETGKMRRAKGGYPGSLTTSHYFHHNGKMYLFEAKTRPAGIAAYDTRTGKYKTLAKLGNTAYRIVRAASGRIYIGEVGGDVSVLDPTTDTVTHYREPSGRRIYWGVYSMQVEEPWVYCGMTNRGKWWLTVIDTRTGKSVNYFDDPPLKTGFVVRCESGAITYTGGYLLKSGKPLMDEKGKPLPWDVKAAGKPISIWENKPWPNMWRVSGYAGQVYRDPLKGLGLEFDMTRAEPNNWNGAVGTIRWRKAGEQEWRRIEITGLKLAGSTPKCLGVAADGNLIGVAQMYGSVFRLDPKTGKSEKIGPPACSVAAILPLKDHTYFSGYPAIFAVYDHNKPYVMSRNQPRNEDTNPKRYSVVGKWADRLLPGPEGRIYIGGRNGRHHTGGGFSIFDPETKQMTRMRKPFEYLGVRGLTFADNHKTLLITAAPIGKGPKRKGTIYLFNVATQKIVKEIELNLPVNPDQIFVAGDTRVVGVSRAKTTSKDGRVSHYTQVYGLDLESGKTVFDSRYPGRAFTGMADSDRTPLVRGPDGCGWLFVDEALCRIHPNGSLEKVRDNMAHRGVMVWHGDTLYIYNGGRMYYRVFANVVRVTDLFRK